MNTVLIKEVNNQPVIFNVDNAVDAARLEALQAVKMAEATAAEIFGDNIKYADNTTCVITENPDNPAFPYNVNFDASKITAKTKRELGAMAVIGMPGDKFIDIELKNNGSGLNQYAGSITAPAAGYVYLNFRIEAQAAKGVAYAVVAVIRNGVQILRYADRCEVVSGGYPSACAFGPVQKGDVCSFYKAFSDNSRQSDAFSRFYYAQGEI